MDLAEAAWVEPPRQLRVGPELGIGGGVGGARPGAQEEGPGSGAAPVLRPASGALSQAAGAELPGPAGHRGEGDSVRSGGGGKVAAGWESGPVSCLEGKGPAGGAGAAADGHSPSAPRPCRCRWESGRAAGVGSPAVTPGQSGRAQLLGPPLPGLTPGPRARPASSHRARARLGKFQPRDRPPDSVLAARRAPRPLPAAPAPHAGHRAH